MTLDQAIAYALATLEVLPAPVADTSTTSAAGPSAGGSGARAGDGPGGLSPREREVAVLVAQGMTSRQIAAALVISRSTAVRHVEHVMAKLGVHSRAQIAAWATAHGLAAAGPR
jgi:DNA-binding NarL/FixJ family response regulator